MKNIETHIHISATPETVYKCLLDFDQYPDWNPFVRSIEGEAREGSQLSISLQNGEKTFRFKPKVLVVRENEAFRWKGKLLVPGLFDGEHYFHLSPGAKGGTDLVHGENFSGLLSGILLRSIGEETRNNFGRMNEALKARAEAI